METEQIEKIFLAETLPAISRDELRQWVVNEKQRGARRRLLVVIASLVVFVVALGGLWVQLDAELNEIRKMVDRQPNGVMKKLEEVTWELCGEPPAGYFVQQLTLRSGSTDVSSGTSF